MSLAPRLCIAAAGVLWLIGAAAAALQRSTGSDIVRQWIVCQYVRSGRDPYPLAREILVARYGEHNPGQAAVYAIPREVPEGLRTKVIPELGPPEATYPPTSVALLAVTIGLLPDPVWALRAWFAINVAAFIAVARSLARHWPLPPAGAAPAVNPWLISAVMLLFPATFIAFAAGQFPLVVLALLFAACETSLTPLARGVALGAALIKPSVALPFLFLPLVRREWKLLITAGAIQALAASYFAFETGAWWTPFRDWLAVSRFFLQGMYTVQDWLNAISPHAPWLMTAVPAGILILCWSAMERARSAPSLHLFALAAMTSAFWTYHGPYDFVVLLPVLLQLSGWSGQPPARQRSFAGLAALAIVALALTPSIYKGDDLFSRLLRWACRGTMIALFLHVYSQVFRSASRRGAPKVSLDPEAHS